MNRRRRYKCYAVLMSDNKHIQKVAIWLGGVKKEMIFKTFLINELISFVQVSRIESFLLEIKLQKLS